MTMLRDEEEIMGVTRDLIASGMSEDALRLVHAIAGKPDLETAWTNMSEFVRRFRDQYERLLTDEKNESATDEALDLVDTAEGLLMKMPAPHLDALRWKLAWMERELGVDNTFTEEMAALKQDVLRLLENPVPTPSPN